MKIKTTDNKGIYIIHDDGLTFSIQFGAGNYCENYEKPFVTNRPDRESKDCEVAVWDREGNWITNKIFPENGEHEEGSCDVIGYVPIEKALRIALSRGEE